MHVYNMLLAMNFDRMLVTDMKEFEHESKFVKKHIPCKHQKEMSCQSVVVRKYLGKLYRGLKNNVIFRFP